MKHLKNLMLTLAMILIAAPAIAADDTTIEDAENGDRKITQWRMLGDKRVPAAYWYEPYVPPRTESKRRTIKVIYEYKEIGQPP